MYKVYNLEKEYVIGTLTNRPSINIEVKQGDDGTNTISKMEWNVMPITLQFFEKYETFDALIIGDDFIAKCTECSLELIDDEWMFKFKHAIKK